MSRKQKPNIEINSKEDYELVRKRIMSKSIGDKLRARISTIIRQKMQGKRKAGSAVKDLGCTLMELMDHLESKFQDGMNWENYGEWHIDHIKPLSMFDLTNEEDFKIAVHYKNLQPLWAIDNLKKSNKVSKEYGNELSI